MVIVPKRALIAVLTAVDLNDKARLGAIKVSNVVADRLLPAKPHALQPPRTQSGPKGPLGVGHVTAEFTGARL